MAFPNPNKYSQNTQNLSRYPNNKLEVLSIMCNKNGEPHPLTKFPPSEWEVRWKHKSVVEGIAICNERDLLPYHGVLGKARQGKATLCLYEGGLRFIWDLRVMNHQPSHSKNKAHKQLQWWTIWFSHPTLMGKTMMSHGGGYWVEFGNEQKMFNKGNKKWVGFHGYLMISLWFC